jgi:hypothetical protein
VPTRTAVVRLRLRLTIARRTALSFLPSSLLSSALALSRGRGRGAMKRTRLLWACCLSRGVRRTVGSIRYRRGWGERALCVGRCVRALWSMGGSRTRTTAVLVGREEYGVPLFRAFASASRARASQVGAESGSRSSVLPAATGFGGPSASVGAVQNESGDVGEDESARGGCGTGDAYDRGQSKGAFASCVAGLSGTRTGCGQTSTSTTCQGSAEARGTVLRFYVGGKRR